MLKRLVKGSSLLLTMLIFTGCSNVTLIPKSSIVYYEYGKEVSIHPSDYLSNSKEILEDVGASSDAVNQGNKNYPEIGEYEVSFTYKGRRNSRVDVKIIVEDTKPPEFNDIKEKYDVEEGNKLTNELFKNNVSDLSPVEIILDDSKVDYNKAGNYVATLKVVDSSKNEAIKEINVVVNEKPKEVVEEVQEQPETNVQSYVEEEQAKSNEYLSNNNQSSSVSNNHISNQSNTVSNEQPTVQESTPPAPTKPEAVQPVTEEPEVKNYRVGNCGILFDSESEATSYAEDYLDKNYKIAYGYLAYSTYDKWSIEFDYY